MIKNKIQDLCIKNSLRNKIYTIFEIFRLMHGLSNVI